jgi:monoamine oxidase
MDHSQKQSILIIGAGAAGLMAAFTLADNYDVTILEARNRTGGRIHSIPQKINNELLETGAEFVHGNLPQTLSLIKKAGLTLEKVTGKMFTVSNCEWKEEEEMIEGWDELLDKMKSLKDDITLDGFLETYFADPSYENLRRHTRAYAAGFDLADPTKASTKSLYREWSQETEDQYRIKEGYGALISFLQTQCEEKGCRILTGKKIKQIDWQKNEVTAYTSGNEKFNAQQVIITLPAGILQQAISDASINITPPLDKYDAAFQHIGYGHVLKIILIFKTAFWQQEHPDTGFIFSEEIIPTWWTQSSTSPVLTGWLGGPAAVQWENISEEKIIETAIGSLSRIFKTDAASIISYLSEHLILRWSNKPASLGAYSYETPLSEASVKILTTPIDNTVYFAGEALYKGPHPGTVEAAFCSGLETAEKILSTKK